MSSIKKTRREPDPKASRSKESSGKERAAEGMQGLAKGIAVIEAFNENNPQMTVARVARITNLHRATARRCLLTLAESGYLSYDGKYFQPTPRMLRLGQTYMKAAPLPQIAEPFLRSARDELGESTSLAIYENGSSLFIARAQAEHIVTIGVGVGSRLPAYGCATGRVLLSGLTQGALTDYLKNCKPQARTPKTLTDRAAIRKAIEAVKDTNYVVTDEELEIGMRSIATPVRNSTGEIVAAMSASAFTARITIKEMVKTFLPVLAQQAERLGRAL
jgi:IclR family pca regulon transcriptional regulator